MIKFWSIARAGAVLLFLSVLAVTSQPSANAASLSEIRTDIGRMMTQVEQSKTDAGILLSIRERTEPLLLELKTQVRDLDQKRLQALQALQRLGPKPVADQPQETAAVLAERELLNKAASTAENDYKQGNLALADAELLWNRATDYRRTLFTHRIFAPSMSPLAISFWNELTGLGLPKMSEKLTALGTEWREHILRPGGVFSLVLLSLLALALIVMLILVPILTRRYLKRWEPADGLDPTRAEIAGHAVISLLSIILPLPIALEIFEAADSVLDLSPDVIDPLINIIALTSAGILLASGILRVLMSPADRRYRIILATDQTARTVTRIGTMAALIYGSGIILAEFTDLIHSMVVVTILDTMLTVGAASLTLMLGLVRLERQIPPEDAPVGLVTIWLGWTRPFIWILAITCLGLVLAGYAALGGFIMGRFIVTAMVVALAILLIIVIDALFSAIFSRKNPKLAAAATKIGISAEIVEIMATVLSGTLRLTILTLTAFVIFGPWHLEYGEANPFEDAFFGFNLSDIRLVLGTAGFALLAFVLGITATRVLVGWLDGQLLPRTRLDQGMRNSTTTILGYGGFALSFGLALSLLGVNPQNLAVVAGALSVGIGFGLQSIVSNFVSGLIVLAERPIRVGDVVLVKGEEGTVKKISVRSTVITGYDRADIIVPNTDLITSVVRNRTFADRTRQLKFSLLLDHAVDPLQAHEICLSCLYHHANILKSPMPKVILVKTDQVGIEMELKGVVDDLDNLENTRSDLMFQILALFKSKGIRLARGA